MVLLGLRWALSRSYALPSNNTFVGSVMVPRTQLFLAVCPGNGRCIDSNPDNTNCFVWERQWGAEDTASATASATSLLPVLYR
jgi:hypothetical protein